MSERKSCFACGAFRPDEPHDPKCIILERDALRAELAALREELKKERAYVERVHEAYVVERNEQKTRADCAERDLAEARAQIEEETRFLDLLATVYPRATLENPHIVRRLDELRAFLDPRRSESEPRRDEARRDECPACEGLADGYASAHGHTCDEAPHPKMCTCIPEDPDGWHPPGCPERNEAPRCTCGSLNLGGPLSCKVHARDEARGAPWCEVCGHDLPSHARLCPDRPRGKGGA